MREGVFFVGDELGKGKGDEVPALRDYQVGKFTLRQPHGLTGK